MLKNFLLLSGENDFLLRQRKRFYEQAFRQKFTSGETTKFEESDSFTTMQSAVLTPNLFGGKRLVFLEAFWTPDKFEQAEKADFFTQLETLQDQVTVISVEPKLDGRLKWSKALKKTAKVEIFAHLKDDFELKNWFEDYAQKIQLQLTSVQIAWLVENLGHNLWHISRELDKLSALAAGEALSDETIKKTVIPNPDKEIWGFLESFSARNHQKSLLEWQWLRYFGHTPHEILPMLNREVRILAQIKSGIDQNLGGKTIAAKTGLHPFVVNKSLRKAEQIDWQTLNQLYDCLYDVDHKLKSGGFYTTTDDVVELDLAIEKVVLKK